MSGLNLPPHDTESEASTLASALMSREALLKVLGILGVEDFYSEQHQILFDAIRELDKKSKPIDVLTVKHYLSDKNLFEKAGGDSYLADLYRTLSTSANAEFYATRVKELSLRRKLIEVSTKIVANSYDLSIDTIELLDSSEKEVFSVTEGRITTDIQDIETITQEAISQIEKFYKEKRTVTGIPTGYMDIDNMLTGLHPSELLILAARPSIGKTSLALNFLNHIALVEKKSVFFFSLEMPAVQLLMRLISIEGMINSQKMRSGSLNTDEMKKIYSTAERFMKSPIIIDDTPGVTLSDIRARARRSAQRSPIGLIIIDYLQLISSTTRADRNQQISEISRGLKLLARELNCPILALSQLSRSVESRSDQRPMLSDLRESGAIEQDADVVMFIYREDKVKPDTEKRNIAEIMIAKQRNGPIGNVELLFWDDYTKFMNKENKHSSLEDAIPVSNESSSY